MTFSVSRLFVGRPVANWEAEDRKLNVFTGLPAMGLDGLGSAAYGPEAALTITRSHRVRRAGRPWPNNLDYIAAARNIVPFILADHRCLSQ